MNRRDELKAKADSYYKTHSFPADAHYPDMMADFALSIEPATRKAAVDGFKSAAISRWVQTVPEGGLDLSTAMELVYGEMFPEPVSEVKDGD